MFVRNFKLKFKIKNKVNFNHIYSPANYFFVSKYMFYVVMTVARLSFVKKVHLI